jgi:hypothetical protein
MPRIDGWEFSFGWATIIWRREGGWLKGDKVDFYWKWFIKGGKKISDGKIGIVLCSIVF